MRRCVSWTRLSHSDVQSYFANLGHGNPQVFYNQVPREDAANYAELFVQLKRYSTRGTPRNTTGL
jgi:hypothetical protein